MAVHRGKSLNYLGMSFELKTKGQVGITIPHHINKTVKEFQGKLRNLTKPSLKSSKLFDVRKEGKDLDPKKAKVFYRLVARLLYTNKRSRPDLAPAVSFLNTMVCKSGENDWKTENDHSIS